MIFREMRKLNKMGYKIIAGVDEAGRGSLAGPVVACAIVFNFKKHKFLRRSVLRILRGVRDAKKFSAKQREKWYKLLTEHPDLRWAVASVSPKIIDKINILEATKLAMRLAIKKLKMNKFLAKESKNEKLKIDAVIIDGNFLIYTSSVIPAEAEIQKFYKKKNIYLDSHLHGNDKVKFIYQKSIPKADEKIFVCMAAGIIAKVTRDRIMRRLHKKYPKYGFDKHKGYGTKRHLEALRKYGLCEIHRKSFRPIKDLLK